MKNIHLIPTDKPSRLLKTIPRGNLILSKSITSGSHWGNLIIYITSDEEIKDCWVLNTHTNKVYFLEGFYGIQPITKKIILTTDPDLIKDDVQAIDDEFLEWFVKNPSCEEVKVENEKYILQHLFKAQEYKFRYKIIIPKEEPKQETLEEAAERLSKNAYKKHSVKDDELSLDEQIQRSGGFIVGFKEGMIEGAKWQQERIYSEEIINILDNVRYWETCPDEYKNSIESFLQQFKKEII